MIVGDLRIRLVAPTGDPALEREAAGTFFKSLSDEIRQEIMALPGRLEEVLRERSDGIDFEKLPPGVAFIGEEPDFLTYSQPVATADGESGGAAEAPEPYSILGVFEKADFGEIPDIPLVLMQSHGKAAILIVGVRLEDGSIVVASRLVVRGAVQGAKLLFFGALANVMLEFAGDAPETQAVIDAAMQGAVERRIEYFLGPEEHRCFADLRYSIDLDALTFYLSHELDPDAAEDAADRETRICNLQIALVLHGERLKIDGILGERTKAAWRRYRDTTRLPADAPTSRYFKALADSTYQEVRKLRERTAFWTG